MFTQNKTHYDLLRASFYIGQSLIEVDIMTHCVLSQKLALYWVKSLHVKCLLKAANSSPH